MKSGHILSIVGFIFAMYGYSMVIMTGIQGFFIIGIAGNCFQIAGIFSNKNN